MKIFFLLLCSLFSSLFSNPYFIFKQYCYSNDIFHSVFHSFRINSKLLCLSFCSNCRNCLSATISKDKMCYLHSERFSSCNSSSENTFKTFNKVSTSNCFNRGICDKWYGFRGLVCQETPCNSYPCLNFGKCIERFEKVNEYTCSCIGGYSGITCAINNGIQISSELTHSNTLQFGERQGYKYCSHGYFVNGIQLRVDPAGGDETALNNIRLECKRPYDNTTGTSVKSGNANEGIWHGTSYCPDGMYMVAFAVRLVPYKGPFSDDYGATDFKFRCRSHLNPHEATVEVHPPGGLSEGEWGPWSSSCSKNSAVCGINPQISIDVLTIDRTGLNAVRFECCKF
ncbi:unnamed protein product [Dimorphilus gyrociliatus]|uniref:EGF-like domain-containing protein n=1 Tax=Dimorphilus gyrociliatus TaxID=2664684 RepID=A0A7I8VEZ8_9ANNE|nr:unnamed protein product [Dimorphilus gyrociliatus]